MTENYTFSDQIFHC